MDACKQAVLIAVTSSGTEMIGWELDLLEDSFQFSSLQLGRLHLDVQSHMGRSVVVVVTCGT